MKHTPVVIGLGIFQEQGPYDELNEALILMEKVALQAIEDCGNKSIADFIDVIDIPKGFWRYRDPGKWIAEKNNFSNARTSVNKIGVLQQNLINSTCKKIMNGTIRAGLILGGESRAKMIAALKEGKEFHETSLTENPDDYVKAKDDLYGPQEQETLGLMAVGYYAVLESAMRNKKGHSHQEHNEYIANMYSEFSKIASDNPHAWQQKIITPNEILDVSKNNKAIAYPYNKYHNTSWNVNQASAMIICSEELADKLSIDKNKRIYPLASSETNHMIAVIQRPDLTESAGLKNAANFMNEKMHELNISPSIVDLYSCFPVAVQQFENTLDISKSVPKTITGGMAFAGGPLNNYMIHATVQGLIKIRDNPNETALISGVSGMMTKQSFCLWSSEKLCKFLHNDVTSIAQLEDTPVPMSRIEKGVGIVIGYTVLYEENTEKRAVFYVEDGTGHRKVITSDDTTIIDQARKEEWVGKEISFNGNHLI